LRDAAFLISGQDAHTDTVSLPLIESHAASLILQPVEQPDEYALHGCYVGLAIRDHGPLLVTRAQNQTLSPRCDSRVTASVQGESPERGQLDFWIDEWPVLTADGTLGGTNSIRSESGGCE
jgi:hypothetical protein